MHACSKMLFNCVVFPLSKLENIILPQFATRLTKFFSVTSVQTKNMFACLSVCLSACFVFVLFLCPHTYLPLTLEGIRGGGGNRVFGFKFLFCDRLSKDLVQLFVVR